MKWWICENIFLGVTYFLFSRTNYSTFGRPVRAGLRLCRCFERTIMALDRLCFDGRGLRERGFLDGDFETFFFIFLSVFLAVDLNLKNGGRFDGKLYCSGDFFARPDFFTSAFFKSSSNAISLAVLIIHLSMALSSLLSDFILFILLPPRRATLPHWSL